MLFSFTKQGLAYPLVFLTGLTMGLSTHFLRGQASKVDPHVRGESPSQIGSSIPDLASPAVDASKHVSVNNGGKVASKTVSKAKGVANPDMASDDTANQNTRLFEDYISAENPEAEAFSMAQQLTAEFDDGGKLLDYLFNRDWPTSKHLHGLLGSLGLFTDKATRREIREYAFDLSQSAQQETRNEGLAILASLNSDSDPEVRQLLLDAGRTETSPEALVQITEGLYPSLIPPAERQEVVSLLTEMAQSSDIDVRAVAINKLGEWERGNSETFSDIVAMALEDDSLDIRLAGIYGLADQESLSTEHRSQLLEIVQNPDDHSQVRMAAAEALSSVNLSEQEYDMIASTLAADGNP